MKTDFGKFVEWCIYQPPGAEKFFGGFDMPRLEMFYTYAIYCTYPYM
jgi:hypothetical protein